MFKWYKQSVRNKILFSILFVFLAMYGLTISCIFIRVKKDTFDTARQEALSTAQIISVALYRNYEIPKDSREIQSYIVGTKRYKKFIEEISVISRDLEIISSTSEDMLMGKINDRKQVHILKSQRSHTETDEDLDNPHIKIWYPVKAGRTEKDYIRGYITLTNSLKPHLRNLNRIRNSILGSGIIILLGIIIVITVLSNSITKPIFRLFTGMKKVVNGNYDIYVRSSSSDEIGFLTTSFNKMIKSIRESQEKIEDYARTLEQLNTAFVMALENANYYNDDNTGNHIKRVSLYSKIIAEGLALESELCYEIFHFSSLHDIGKVGIPDKILKKEGSLTDEEFRIIKTHPVIGFKIIDTPAISPVAKNIVSFHHERYDGTGYPKNLKGKEIPMEARIIALADVYDALRTIRPYKPAFTREKTEKIIVDSSGSHFDPDVIAFFKSSTERFDEIHTEYLDRF
jgi:HD-GYP domain-containing protein (c-di-GMP phosphodiesterase class II)